MRSEHEIRQDEPIEPPLLFEDSAKKSHVFPAELPVDGVVRAHDRRCATFIHGGAEMSQVDLAERPFVDRDVDLETRVLDAVDGVVLRVGEDVALNPLHGGNAHPREEVYVFAVRLLGAPPTRMS